MKYGIYIRPEVPVYLGNFTTEKNDKGQTVSAMADESLYGSCCQVLKIENGWAQTVSSYGYPGYVKESDLIICSKEQANEWLQGLMVTKASSTDVLTAPTVHGSCIITLPRGAEVKPVKEEDGWTRVSLADGTEGYVPSVRLGEKRYDDSLLWEDAEDLMERQEHAIERRKTEIGGSEAFNFQKLLDKYYEGSEDAFRKNLTDIAVSYLGTQYRWAGRSSRGIDCSGMVGMCYLLSGVAIYRDASIVRDYPMKRLELKWQEGKFSLDNIERKEEDGYDVLKPGDALYFPGHVAMYLGDGLYIHSTGKAGSNGVVYNSLLPDHELFREDLLDSLYAAGGLRL